MSMTTKLTDIQIQELLEALNAATPGNWFRLHDTPPEHQADDVEDKIEEDGSQLFKAQPMERTCNCAQVWSLDVDGPVAYCAVRSSEEADGPTKSRQMANAKLIGLMKTYLPDLLDEIIESRCKNSNLPVDY
jgi:hypothetical protein